ncbi:GM11625 [Drosophila sechellia]|uniref:GM11625 n=1 Tax=Drosophila sechellia TaxID=7238 RepID=B4IGR6_DROSE|nr:GM11625 [Drosophila sechellia]
MHFDETRSPNKDLRIGKSQRLAANGRQGTDPDSDPSYARCGVPSGSTPRGRRIPWDTTTTTETT